MDPERILSLPKDPLSLILLKEYTKRKVKSMKDSLREKAWKGFFSPEDFDYSKYERLLSKHLFEEQYGKFKGLFVELFVREWFSNTQNFSLEEKVNLKLDFLTPSGEKRSLEYKTVDSGVVVEREYISKNASYRTRFTEIDLLGFYSNGFDASFFVEVKSNGKRDYYYKRNRRTIYTALESSFKNNVPLGSNPVLYFHVHGSDVIDSVGFFSKRHRNILNELEREYGNLIIIEFPLKEMNFAVKKTWKSLRKKYHIVEKEKKAKKEEKVKDKKRVGEQYFYDLSRYHGVVVNS